MHENAVEILRQETAYTGYCRIDRYTLRHAKFAGGLSGTLIREVFQRGRISAVLPVDTERDELVLIEQFRPGAMAAGWDPWMVECVAGVMEPGETPEEVARRESLEEANCVITDLHPIGEFLYSPGISTESVSLFCGRADARGVGGLHGLANEGEDIRASVVPVREAVRWLDEGRFKNAKTLIALHWLARHYDWLKAHWA